MTVSSHALRRRFIATVGTGLVGTLTGCLDMLGAEPDDTDASPTTDDGEWRNAALEDVRTGESFSIDEFDVPVFVHTFAVWCSTCQRQHGEFGTLIEESTESFEVVELNIDPNEDADAVRSHADSHGFTWRFAVSPPAVTEALVADFGSRITSPPQSPVILVCDDDGPHVLDKVRPAADLDAALEEHC